MAVSAIVTAVIALVVGVWENVQERQHNRLSVIPALEYVVELREAPDAEPDDAAQAVQIRMINEGVGPAVLRAVEIRITDDAGQSHSYASWGAAAPELRALGVTLAGRSEISSGSMISVGRELLLARLELPAGPDGSLKRRVDELLQRLQITLVYESIYGDTYRATLGG